MLGSTDYTVPSLANSLQDLLRRQRLDPEVGMRLALECQALARAAEWSDLPRDQIAWAFATRVRALGQVAMLAPDAGLAERLDYVALLAHQGGDKP